MYCLHVGDTGLRGGGSAEGAEVGIDQPDLVFGEQPRVSGLAIRLAKLQHGDSQAAHLVQLPDRPYPGPATAA
jgi:hypothetical protein